jgi:glycosyltransferase involved in cell wall biosynthesis
VEAARLLRDDPRIVIVMVGDGPTKESLVAKAKAEGLTNIVFHPRQSKDRMPALLASMDASLIPLSASLPGTMPSKVYEALAAGVPMIVTAGCEAEQLVRRYDTGRLFEAGDAGQLAAAIRELASDAALCERLKANSLELSKRFDRDRIAGNTEQLLVSVAAGEPIPAVEW